MSPNCGLENGAFTGKVERLRKAQAGQGVQERELPSGQADSPRTEGEKDVFLGGVLE